MELTFEERVELIIQKREDPVKPFVNDPILSTTIPEATAGLLHDQFRINLPAPKTTVPIVVSVAWKEILKYVQKQTVDEFSMDVAGVSVKYVTDLSESDKPTNIVPQLTHKKFGIFTIEAYTSWRKANITENVMNLENKIFITIFNEYDINLGEPISIFPILSCAYTAAVSIAKDTRTTVNFYNLFEIDVMNDDQILLKPLKEVKYI